MWVKGGGILRVFFNDCGMGVRVVFEFFYIRVWRIKFYSDYGIIGVIVD